MADSQEFFGTRHYIQQVAHWRNKYNSVRTLLKMHNQYAGIIIVRERMARKLLEKIGRETKEQKTRDMIADFFRLYERLEEEEKKEEYPT